MSLTRRLAGRERPLPRPGPWAGLAAALLHAGVHDFPSAEGALRWAVHAAEQDRRNEGI